MDNMKWIPLTVGILFILSNSLFGQKYHFTYYNSNDGLPSDLVKASAIDNEGFVFVATDNGLATFDGTNFTSYPNLTTSRYIKHIKRTIASGLLVSDDQGISIVYPNKDQTKSTLLRKGGVHKHPNTLWYPKLIFEDDLKRVWLTDNNDIYAYEDNKLKPYKTGITKIPENVQRSFIITSDGYGNLFAFFESGGVFKLDEKTKTFVPILTKLGDTKFHYAASFKKGEILVCGNQGLSKLTTNKQGVIDAKLLLPKVEFSWLEKLNNTIIIGSTWSDGIYEIKTEVADYSFKKIAEFQFSNANHINKDFENNLWLSTDNGLVLMQAMFFSPLEQFNILGYIQDIRLKQDGAVVVSNGTTVYQIEHKNKLHYIQTLYNSPKASILKLLPMHDTLWLADGEGVIQVLVNGVIKKRYPQNEKGAIFILETDQLNRIWYCQDGINGIRYLDKSGKQCVPSFNDELKSKIICIKYHPQSQLLYFGGTSDDAYLYCYDSKNNKLTNLSVKLSFNHNVPIAVNDICFDKEGKLILATTFGVLVYNGKELERIDLGLETESTIKSIAMDVDGGLWATASTGLIKVAQGDRYFFAEKDGIPSKTSTYRSLVIDSTNQLWLGTIAGLGHSGNNLPAELTPKPVLWKILRNGKSIDSTNHYKFSNKSIIRLLVNVPSYPGSAISFQIRQLNSKDTSEWKACTSQVEYYLTDFKTGKYKLQIRCKKEGNFSWSNPTDFSFEVTRVWFEKWWVISVLIALLVCTIYLLLKYQRTKLKKEQAKLERIISERTKEISDQNKQISTQNNYILSKNQELELTNRELVLAKEKAEKLGMAKSQFLSTMSHELRTPMNAVIGMTYILLNENPKPDQVDNLQTLKFSAENLMALINDILDFSKIDAGKITFEDADFDLRDKINSVIQVIKVKADEKGVKVVSEIDPALPEYLIGDPTRLNQILFNLAGNAVKFTDEGQVTIKVEVLGKSTTDCALAFKISDTGIGIAPDKISSIFDSFTQASLEITRKFGGTGLGLAITKKLVELQGGKISVDSELNSGATFTVQLTYRISEKTNDANQDNLPETLSYFNGQTVLVVDDNQINLIVAKKFLTKWNLNVETAENGKIAVELVQKTDYKLILMDLQMPELDGYHATKIIRHYEITNGLNPVPIIALTASALIEVKNNIKATGMDDFITKPFNPNELNYKISKYLRSVDLA